MEKIIPDRVHPQALHIRANTGSAELSDEAIEALVLKRFPYAALCGLKGAALLGETVKQIIVELVAVCNRRKRRACAEAIYHEAVLGENDIDGKILDLADKGCDLQCVGNNVIPARNGKVSALDLAGLGNADMVGSGRSVRQEICVEQLGGFKLVVCDVELDGTVYALAHLVRFGDNIAVFERADKL